VRIASLEDRVEDVEDRAHLLEFDREGRGRRPADEPDARALPAHQL